MTLVRRTAVKLRSSKCQVSVTVAHPLLEILINPSNFSRTYSPRWLSLQIEKAKKSLTIITMTSQPTSSFKDSGNVAIDSAFPHGHSFSAPRKKASDNKSDCFVLTRETRKPKFTLRNITRISSKQNIKWNHADNKFL